VSEVEERLGTARDAARRLRRVLRRGALAGAFAGLLPLSGVAPAQEQSERPSDLDETALALSWLQGRFKSPLTCVRRDGSRVDIEEALVIRQGTPRSGTRVARITFFGIDLPDAIKCSNLLEPRVPDRRGVLYVTYRSNKRADMGAADFRRTLREGVVRYEIVGGELRVRALEGDAEAPRTVPFLGGDHSLLVRPVLPQSDGAKILERYRTEHSEQDDARRSVLLEIEGPESFRFSGTFIEDDRRWR
jgi:hypothetical protein